LVRSTARTHPAASSTMRKHQVVPPTRCVAPAARAVAGVGNEDLVLDGRDRARAPWGARATQDDQSPFGAPTHQPRLALAALPALSGINPGGLRRFVVPRDEIPDALTGEMG